MRSWDWQEMVTLLLIPVVYAVLVFTMPGGDAARLAAVFLFIFFSYKIGEKLVRDHPVKTWIIGAFALAALTVLFQVAAYYASIPLGNASDAASLILAIWSLSLVLHFFPAELEERESAKIPREDYGWTIALLLPATIAVLYVLRLADSNATSVSVRTPWPFFPPEIFIALGLLPVAAWVIANKTGRASFTAIFAGLSVISTTLIAPLFYKLGFGFDGFLHRASQTILLTTGTLEPKPLYYMGQYALTTWLSRLLELSIANLDRFLVPVGLLGVIAALALAVKPGRAGAFAVAGAASLMALSPFVATTPQAFAYIVGISALILAFGAAAGRIHFLAPVLLALWCMSIHPLAGLPFFGAVAAVLYAGFLRHRDRRIFTSPVIYLLALGTSLSVPTAFFLLGSKGAQTIAWDFSKLGSSLPGELFGMFMSIPANHVALWADWSNYVAYLLPIVLWTLAFLALRDETSGKMIFPVILISVGSLIAGIFLNTVGEFAFLISYERSNYSERLVLISQLLLLYPALIGFGRVSKNMSRKPATAMIAFLLFFAAWHAAHVYNALPRHDAAAASRGWSVGALDFEAIRYIEQSAAGQTYTVLANQSVSAAAVETYGFARYVRDERRNEDIFYYPIPTGGTLYQLFLRAVAPDPSFDAISEAGELGQSEIVYVVLNDYWWDAERVGRALEEKADEVRSFGNDQVRVFRFTVPVQR